MSVLEEIKADFGQMIITLGIILGCVVLFLLYNVSIWLVVGLLILAVAGYFIYKHQKGG